MRTLFGFVFLIIGSLQIAGAARAETPRRDRDGEAKIEADLDRRAPGLGAKFRAATEALDARRLAEARPGFEAVLAKVPEHAASLRRLSYVDASERGPAAVGLARRALEAEPGWDGKFALTGALLSTQQAPALEEAAQLADQMYNERSDEPSATMVAEVAFARRDLLALKRAVEALGVHAPEGLSANYYRAIYHLLRDEPGEAEGFLRRAEAAGLPAPVAADLRERGGINRRRQLMQGATAAGWALVAWLLCLGAIFVLGRWLSRKALAAIDEAQGSEDLRRRTTGLRATYARILNLAGVYYYLSIPVLLVIVLGGAGALLYGLLLLGHIPVKLLLLILVGALASAWAMVRSLVHRRAEEPPPGRRIVEEEAPGLWNLLREVAARVGTRPVDDVYLTPGTEVAVAERGPVRARMADRGHRYLMLGAGVLEGFSQQSFRAVLAHEYGHFSNRDTAGGGLVMAVQGSLLRALIGLAERGGLLIINPAWHFMRVFYGLFLRIALGASRVKEVMADHFAATSYGPRAFADGLTHVIRRSVAFDQATGLLLRKAETTRLALASLYHLPEGEHLPSAELEQAVDRALSDAGSPYDSHPPPHRRIEWVLRLPEPSGAPPASGDAWELFARRPELEAEMTRLVNTQLEEAGTIEPAT